MRIQLVVLDSDRDYLDRLATHLSAAHPGRLDIHAFTDVAAALDAAARVRAHVFLDGSAPGTTIDQMPHRCVLGRFVDSASIAQVGETVAVPRFTSIDDLYRRITALAEHATGDMQVTTRRSGSAARLVVVSSGSGGLGTSTVALALARTLAMQHPSQRTLLLDLSMTGGSLLGSAHDGPTFSDVIYSLKRRRGDLGARLTAVAVEDDYGVRMFNAASDPGDRIELDRDDLALLVEAVVHNAETDVVVVDVPFETLVTAWETFESIHRLLLVTDDSREACTRAQRALRIFERLDQLHETGASTRTSLILNRTTLTAPGALADVPAPTSATLPRFEALAYDGVVEAVYASGQLHGAVATVLA